MYQVNNQFKHYGISVLLGAGFYYLLIYFWTYFPNVNPLFQWLLSCCTRAIWFRPVIFLQDLFINILLWVPLAFIIFRLKPINIWACAFFTVLPISFLGGYDLFTLFALELPYVDISYFAMVWVTNLFSLPAAMLVLILIGKHENT